MKAEIPIKNLILILIAALIVFGVLMLVQSLRTTSSGDFFTPTSGPGSVGTEIEKKCAWGAALHKLRGWSL